MTLDLIRMDKEMSLFHQLPTKPLSSYLSKFKGTVNVVKSLEGSPWLHPAAAKIVFNKLYGPRTVFALAKASNSAEYKAAATELQCRYLAPLFFHGLSNKVHWDLKKKVHNNALTESDSVPCTYNNVLRLVDQYILLPTMPAWQRWLRRHHLRINCPTWSQGRRMTYYSFQINHFFFGSDSY
jgi:hypothetical protein